MDQDRLDLTKLRRRYVDRRQPLPADLAEALTADGRAAARAILDAVQRRRSDNRSEGQRLRWMLRYERPLWDQGVALVGGCDEVGMAALAGPVVAAAVILPRRWRCAGIDDSKKLTAPARERLAAEIRRCALAWAVGEASPGEVDRLNIYQAGLLAMRRAVLGLEPAPEIVLVDGRRIPELPFRQEKIVGGDGLSLSIAAASIVAKTIRDAVMVALDAEHPGYGFAHHKGYPVPEHREAIRRLGILPVHRRSFGTVRHLHGQQPGE